MRIVKYDVHSCVWSMSPNMYKVCKLSQACKMKQLYSCSHCRSKVLRSGNEKLDQFHWERRKPWVKGTTSFIECNLYYAYSFYYSFVRVWYVTLYSSFLSWHSGTPRLRLIPTICSCCCRFNLTCDNVMVLIGLKIYGFSLNGLIKGSFSFILRSIHLRKKSRPNVVGYS